MKKFLIKAISVVGLALAPLLFSTAVRAAADTCTWTGLGTTDIFSDAANWSVCDNGNVPESGDTLVFPTSVDSDTTSGDDRMLTNDMVSMTFAGVQISGSYATGDTDYYRIGGNAFSVSGDIVGNAAGNQWPVLNIDVDLTATAPLAIEAVTSTGSLGIGANAVTLKESYFSGGLSGSGAVLIRRVDTPLSLGGGAASCGTADPSIPFGGDSSGYSGAVSVQDMLVSVTPRTNDLLRHASSVTLNANATLGLYTDNGSDMTFATPLTLNGGTLATSQPEEATGCNPADTINKVTITSAVTATQAVRVSLNKSDLILSGTVTGAEYITVMEGLPTNVSLTIGSIVTKSPLQTTTITGDQSGSSAYLSENQLTIISQGATYGGVTIAGGVLKGLGTIGSLSMSAGTVAPGLSPGCLTSGNLSYTGGSLEIEINGATVCTEYDQQIVNGTVDLGTATTLVISRLSSYRPNLNDTYVIINNDGTDAVTGTFAGLAQGATTVVDGVTYTISYTGGEDGNDVVLTVTAVDASVGAPNTGVVQIFKSGIILPLIAIAAAFGMVGLNLSKKTK